MSNFSTLVNVIDKIRDEALGTPHEQIYLPDRSRAEAVNQARSRAYIHLYLKVSFGLLDFVEREALITDGRADGGIDGYHIHAETRTVYLIQSKYRITESNFETKLITANELLVMDINRILEGHNCDERGQTYNGQIQAMQMAISSIDDIGRYKYKVIILANAPDLTSTKLRQLTGGFPTEVFNFERSYLDLIFPVISGAFFKAVDIQIALDLSNKNAGTKISYEVATSHHACEITVLFVPTGEIARVMKRYKNSLLTYNPRSYLELAGHLVNDAIRDTILRNDSNEFALFNNGLTILSDETNINEKIGQRNKAQLILRNPQIINGGQTAYTLSRILEELPTGTADDPFDGKEVLVKIITLVDRDDIHATPEQKLQLIDRISTASNQQTPVIAADKNSNDQEHIEIQKVLFDRYGLLYERKRGEFADGLHQGYITADVLVERNLFFRLYYAVIGNFTKAVQKRLFLKIEDPLQAIRDNDVLDRLYFAFLCYRRMAQIVPENAKMARSRGIYLRLYALAMGKPERIEDYPDAADTAVANLPRDWAAFQRAARSHRQEFWYQKLDRKTGETRPSFHGHDWLTGGAFIEDVARFFGKVESVPEDIDSGSLLDPI